MLGSTLVFAGGFLKATWKLLYTLGIADIQIFSTIQFILLAPGFLALLVTVILYFGSDRCCSAMMVEANRPTAPACSLNSYSSLNLPVILLYDGQFYCFSSSRFHNESHSYQGFTLATEGPHKGKIVRSGENKTNPEAPEVYDFSITKTVLAIMISAFLLILIFVSMARMAARSKGKAPTGMQNLLEPLVLFVRDDIARSSIGEKHYEKFLPYLLTIFFFILFNNLFGLIPFFPGGANVTGNITVTLVMAVFTFILTTINGNKHYWIDIINTPGVPWWLKIPLPLMPIVEIIGIITKPFVLMVRLFANITAGHIIALGFVSLIFIFGAISAALGLGVSVVSVAFMVFMDLLELLVAFIQAYVFTLLSALYFGLAVTEPEHH